MASFKLVFRKSVAKDLRAIPKADVARLLARIRTIAQDPRGPGCEKLSGMDRYRVRQGRYRILYEVIDEQVVVIIVKVAHRRELYR